MSDLKKILSSKRFGKVIAPEGYKNKSRKALNGKVMNTQALTIGQVETLSTSNVTRSKAKQILKKVVDFIKTLPDGASYAIHR